MVGINMHRLRNTVMLVLAMLAGFAVFHDTFRHDAAVGSPTTSAEKVKK